MPIRVAINGFGRIGRSAFKAGCNNPDLEFVAVNDLTEPATLAHLLRYDTAFGHFDGTVAVDGSDLVVNGKHIKVIAEKEPTKLPWGDLKIDVVLECTGRFTNADGAQQHITAGARRVVVSAPVKGGNVPTYVFGANSDDYKGEQLINNASCTTNCIAPVAQIVHETFGIQKALMTTIHAVTAEQNLVDGPPPGGKSNDLRRARAAYMNMVPTSTGAAIATTEAIPELKGLFDGLSIRVPIIDVSLSDFTFLLARKTSKEELNDVFTMASEQPRWKGIVVLQMNS